MPSIAPIPRPRPRTAFRSSLVTAAALAALSLPASAPLLGADFLVSESDNGPELRGALLRVDGETGQRSVLSDFNDPALGDRPFNPRGLDVTAFGDVIMADRTAGTDGQGALFRINPVTGQRVMLSDMGDPAQGPLEETPHGVAIESDGGILVAGFDSDLILRVDPISGQRTVVSDFRDPAQGPPAKEPWHILIDDGDTLWVTGRLVDIGQAAVFRVDATDGSRTVVTDFFDSSQGVSASLASGIAKGNDGLLWVLGAVPLSDRGILVGVDPATGERTLLVDLDAPGTLGCAPDPVWHDSWDLVAEDGFAFVLEHELLPMQPRGGIYRVDPATATVEIVTCWGDPTQGVTADIPFGLTLAPEPPIFADGFESGDASRWDVIFP